MQDDQMQDDEVHLLYRPRAFLAGAALGASALALLMLVAVRPPHAGSG